MSDADTFISFYVKWPVPWVMLFVEAPIDAVSDAYEESLKRPVERNLPISPAGELSGLPFNTVVQVQGSDWVIVFHEFDGVIPVLGGFHHRVLEFAGGEGSLVTECNLCVPFESPIKYRTRRDQEANDDYYNHSNRKRPKEHNVGNYSEVFDEFGIRPVCVERSQSGSVLLPNSDSEKNVVRVDAADSKWFDSP